MEAVRGPPRSASDAARISTGASGGGRTPAFVPNDEPETGTLIAPDVPAAKSRGGRTSSTVASPGAVDGPRPGGAATNGPRLSATIRSLFGGRSRADADRLGDELVHARRVRSIGLKRRSKPIVVEAFELIAAPHSEPATWPGIDLDAVARARPAGAGCGRGPRRPRAPRRRGRPRRVADEQRVAGEDEPRLVGARAVDDREAAVLGPVPGRVERRGRDLAELDARRRRRAARTGTRARRPGGSRRDAVLEGEAARAPRRGRRACASRASHEPDAAPRGLLEVRLDGERGVDDDRDAGASRRRSGRTRSRGRRRRTG